MMDEPKTGREAMMVLNEERGVEYMLRRCVMAAIEEIEPGLRDPRTEQIAYRAAQIATEETARSLVEARRLANKLAALTPLTPVIFPDANP